MTNYYNPVKIIKTENWLFELNRNIENLEISSPAVITSPGNRKRLNLDLIFPPDSIFSEVDRNTNFENCINAIKFFRKKKFDGVIALGGGSAMDLAKVVMAYLCLDISDIYELINYKRKFPRTIPSIFLPTTHGTASEVTMWGTVWNTKEEKKYSISHPDLYPSVAILDGNLTLSLPLDISITTVMDALSHSLEAIWNKNHNPTSTKYAIEAICIIIDNINHLKSELTNLALRNKFLYASTLAGLAFSNTKTAAAHSMSYPLTIYYGIPHGIASSLTLVSLLQINASSISDALNEIYSNLRLSGLMDFSERIKSIPNNIISYRLRDWGVKKEDLNRLTDQSFTKGRMDNNIVDIYKPMVKSILKDII